LYRDVEIGKVVEIKETRVEMLQILLQSDNQVNIHLCFVIVHYEIRKPLRLFCHYRHTHIHLGQ